MNTFYKLQTKNIIAVIVLLLCTIGTLASYAQAPDRTNGIEFTVVVDTGKLLGLYPNYSYWLNPNPHDSIHLDPPAYGFPMKITVRGQPSTVFSMSLGLPDSLLPQSSENGLIGCSWSQGDLYNVDTDEQFDPIQSIVFQIDADSTVVFQLGGYFQVPHPISRGNFIGSIACHVEDTASNQVVESIGWFLATVEYLPPKVSAYDGEVRNLRTNQEYTLDPNPYDTLTITPIVGGTEYGAPMEFDVKGEPGSVIRISFSLPSSLIDESGRSIPCSFGQNSAYLHLESGGVIWNVNSDTVIMLDENGWANFFLGITVSIPDTAVDGEYSDTVQCSLSYVDSNVYKTVQKQSSTTVNAIFRATVRDYPLQVNFGYGEVSVTRPRPDITYVLNPDPSSPTPVTPSGEGTPMWIEVKGRPSALVTMSFLLPTRLIGYIGVEIPCSWDAESLLREDKQQRYDPKQPVTFQIDSNGTAIFYLGITFSVPMPQIFDDIKYGAMFYTVVDTATGEDAFGVGTFEVNLSSYELLFFKKDGEIKNLSKGHAYTLDPNPNDSISVTPIVNGTETGTPMEIKVDGIPGSWVFVDFILPTSLVDTISGRQIPCFFSTNSAYWGNLDTTWNPNDSVVTTIDGSGVLPIHLGISVSVPDTAIEGTYKAEVGVVAYYSGFLKGSSKFTNKQAFIMSTFTVHVSGSSGINDEQKLPTEFNLAQNYPNPFNPTTIINYQLPSNSHVVLKVYNMLGQEAATLVNEKREAGKHTVEFDASRLTSGVYFYRIQAGSFTQTKKLLLLR
jgi:hypothetical protein